MADLRGVIFVGNGRSADGAAASDGGGVQLDATVDHLRGIGADDITVITADPDAFSAESGLQVQDWNPGEGQVCGLLRAVPRTEEVELLVAEHPLQPTAEFQASQGSNNCVLVVVEDAAVGRPVDLVELEYEERRRVTQFAVRSVNDDGSYRHSGLTFLPIGALDLAALVGFLRQLEADGQHEALSLTQARLRTRAADDVLQDIAGMNLDDLFDRFLFEGRLTAIKA